MNRYDPTPAPAHAAIESSAERAISADFSTLPSTGARLSQLIAEGSVCHGLQLYVSLNGHCVTNFAYGEARPGIRLRRDTLCRQNCTGKPLTVLALGLLVSERQADLSDTVCHYLPQFAARGKGRVTIKHLLTHTAGLHSSLGLHRVPPSEDEVLRRAYQAALPPGWRLGHDAAYSSLVSWQLLGKIVEEVSAQPLRTFLRSQILLPLGMRDTWIGMTADQYADMSRRIGINYYAWAPHLLPRPLWIDGAPSTCCMTIPANGTYAPARDLATFYETLQSPALVEQLTRVHSDFTKATRTPQRPRTYDLEMRRDCNYGLGFMIGLKDHYFGEYCSPTSFGHSGARGASFAFLDPTYDLVIAVIFNDVIDSMSSFLRRISIVNAIYRDLDLPKRATP